MDSPQQASDERQSDEWYEEELKKLEKDREKILADAGRKISEMFPHLECQIKLRLKTAMDYRDLQLKNAHNHYKIEVQQACNEFERGKRRLQSAMLDIAAERRRRLEVTRNGAISKKRRRGRTSTNDRFRSSKPSIKSQPFITSLEAQGLVRIALTPDEVNADLEGILQGVDSAKLNGFPALLVNTPQEGGIPKQLEKVHSSRGILHYHDATYEKNDRVAVYSNTRPKPTLRYEGTVISVISKEITIRSDDGKSLSAVSFSVYSLTFAPLPGRLPFFLFLWTRVILALTFVCFCFVCQWKFSIDNFVRDGFTLAVGNALGNVNDRCASSSICISSLQ